MYLILMSILAGILTGIVGMASLTLYPVLISIGIPPITANATITVAQVSGGLGTIMSSSKQIKRHWAETIFISFISTIGGVIGAFILINSSNSSFKKMVPLFIFIAGVMILVPKKDKSIKNKREALRITGLASVFLVGIYNGYFGAGAGLLMIAVLSKIINEKYEVYNAIRNFSSLCNNLIVSIIFIFTINIQWKIMIPLIFGLFIGGYIGPIIVRIVPSKLIKLFVGVFAIILSLFLFYKEFL